MEQSKLQKIAGAIIPILIVAGVFGYRFYNNYTVDQTNKFIKSYNSFTYSLNFFINTIETKVDENGNLKNPSDLDNIIKTSKDLNENGCSYITKSELKNNCIEIFKDYSVSFQELKDKGYSEELDKKFEDLDTKLTKFEKDLTEKLGVEFK